jgi:alkylated DNA nucleotide flippase Atl1
VAISIFLGAKRRIFKIPDGTRQTPFYPGPNPKGVSGPWPRVINYFGGLSTYKVGSGERQRVLLEEEGLSFRADGTIDLNRNQWRPGLEIINKLSLPDR